VGESFAGITVPDGDPGALRDAASDLARVAGGLDDSASALRSMPGGLAWQGLAAGGFASSCVTSSSAAGQSANGVRMVAPALARCADDLEDARREARAAIVEAKEAKREIKAARAALAKAGGARREAEGRSVAAEIVLTTTGVFGAPSDAAAEAKRGADSDAAQAAGEEQRAGRALERAEEALERAQKKGNDAEQDARDGDRALAGVFGAAGLFVGQSPAPPPPPPPPKDEPGFWEKAWDNSLGRLGDGTPLQGPLTLAEHLSPGFREDFGRAVVEDTAVGVKDLAVTGVQLSPTYRLVDPDGQDRKAAQLRDTAKFAWQDPGEFFKQASGANHLEDGHPGSFVGGWVPALIPVGGAAVRGTTALSRLQRAVPEKPKPGAPLNRPDDIYEGMEVYRFHGYNEDAHGLRVQEGRTGREGESVPSGAGPWGRSWTDGNPFELGDDPRSLLGLPTGPDGNPARFLSIGELRDIDEVSRRDALPLDGNPGGAPELVVPDPQRQIELKEIHGLNPEP